MIPRVSKRTATVLVLVATLLLAGCTGPGGGAETPAEGTGDAPMEPATEDQTPEPEGGGDAGGDEPAGTAEGAGTEGGTA